MFNLAFYFCMQYYYFSMTINGFLWNFTVFWNHIVRIQKKKLVRVLYSYTFFMNLLSFGIRSGNIFYWVIPVNVIFIPAIYLCILYIHTTIVTSEKLKAFHWNFFLTFFTRITIVKLVLWKKVLYYQKRKSCNYDGILLLLRKNTFHPGFVVRKKLNIFCPAIKI